MPSFQGVVFGLARGCGAFFVMRQRLKKNSDAPSQDIGIKPRKSGFVPLFYCIGIVLILKDKSKHNRHHERIARKNIPRSRC